MIQRVAKTITKWGFRIILFVLITSLAFNAFSYLNFDSNYGFLRLKQKAIETGWYLPAYYSHVIIAGLVLLIGLFQINTRWSLKWRKVHRLLGRCYAYGVLFFAAPGGLVMSFFIQRGPWVLSSFVLQSVLWFAFTAIAVDQIRKGKVADHRRWMWRSYALTFAAVTLRLYAFGTSWSFDLSEPGAYGVIAWLSWVLNLLTVEVYLRFSKSETQQKIQNAHTQ